MSTCFSNFSFVVLGKMVYNVDKKKWGFIGMYKNRDIAARLHSYHIETYGCQMNVRDSETIAGLLQSLGMTRAASMQEADFILFNTCCVRDHAERRVFGNVGFTRMIKEERPNIVIAVCGCMMQQRDVADKLFKRFPFVDLVFGTHVLHKLPQMLDAVCAGDRLCITSEEDSGIVEGLPSLRPDGQSAFVNIMFGCNNFCTYCIVPYVRGRERSRTPEAIETEVRELVASGYTEITLLGQNVNSYGRGLPNAVDFPDLLHRLDRIEGLKRLRFMTSHPKDLSGKLIAAMATLSTVCHHIHLPMQSGSDRILKAMNRRYTGAQYTLLVDKLRAAVPDVEITTDIIVGFPGETEQDFDDTMAMVERIGFAAAYTFQYSPRAGTQAAEMEEQIPPEVKSERLQRLNELQTRMTEQNNRKYINAIGEVLVEGAGQRDGASVAFGKFSNFKMVYFPGDEHLIGQYVTVCVQSIKGNSLFGVLKEDRK